ncbi:hypothetical protein [Kitasatospora sp. NPDC059817]|uniref:hypothetical protein n=1 Tax=Kitasatospora sp. NPDC059817 TaxID=3346961 RepID=UPI003647990E
MEFRAGTIRITSLDYQRHLAAHETAVLRHAATLGTEGRTLDEVQERYGIVLPDGHPKEWAELTVTVGGLVGSASDRVQAQVQEATRTSEAAIEAWSAEPGPDGWAYLIVPSIRFETLGACVAVSRTRDEVVVAGDLHPAPWGDPLEDWFVDRNADGLRRPFAPAALVPPGVPWAIHRTNTPPPDATT